MHHPLPRVHDGFTLVELLGVIVIVGILAAVVTFVVRDALGDAEESACEADRRVLVVAEQAYEAQHGRYATEQELADSGLIRAQSHLNDIAVAGDEFTVITVPACTAGPPPPATVAGPGPATTTTLASTTTPLNSTTTVATTTTTSPGTTTTTTQQAVSSTTSSSTTTTTTTAAPTTTSSTTTTTTVPSNRLVFSVQPTSTAVDAAFSPAIAVSVRDASNTIVTASTASVTLTITTGTGSPAGRLTCTTNPRSVVNGVATFSGCSINKRANGYTLTATSPGLTAATSSAFNIT